MDKQPLAENLGPISVRPFLLLSWTIFLQSCDFSRNFSNRNSWKPWIFPNLSLKNDSLSWSKILGVRLKCTEAGVKSKMQKMSTYKSIHESWRTCCHEWWIKLLLCSFHYAYHPRHGFAVIVLASADIEKDEEIFCHYHYPKKSSVPHWYADLYEEQVGEEWPGTWWQDTS